nr:copper resistance protein B [uncultured Parasphingorhabdus sp.]
MSRTSVIILPALAAAMLPVSAQAQDHDAHQGHATPATSPEPAPSSAPQAKPIDPHAGHVMPAPAEPDQPSGMEDMDHSAMDHDAMDHDQMEGAASPGPEIETSPPADAPTSPPRAADAIWGADAMRASREDLQKTHGDYPLVWFQADRAEVQFRQGSEGYLWDIQGYYGGTTSKFWFKSEGEGSFGEPVEDAEIQALYSRAIAPFFDLQAGVRQDIAGPDTTHAVIGIQGVAPYIFEIDGAIFLSHRGDLTARFEAELDQKITQRLILQPRTEINLSAQDIPELGIGAGIDNVELGLRLRYEIKREFAPYIGVEQSWRVGGSADYASARGEDNSVTNYVVGIRFWF